jgi:arginase
MRPIGLIGVPANSSGRRDGVARAPAALRAAGIVQALDDVRDYGDVVLPDPSSERDPRTRLIDPSGFVAVMTAVRDAVGAIVAEGRFPLVLGGDCPLLLGCLVAARAGGSPGLLFVDGHEDAYLPEQSTTGEGADTELAFALGIADATWSPELAAAMPVLTSGELRILGARDASGLRAEGVPSLGDRVTLVDDRQLAADPSGCARRATSSLPPRWWFHLDLDVLSTEAFPTVDYPQPGGVAWDDLLLLATAAFEGDPLGWDITIYNPDLDPDRAHAGEIVRLVASVLGSVGA